MKLSDYLEIRPGLTAVIGGGGKTTLLYALAEELRKTGSVLLCTSTHIRIPPQYPLVTGDDAAVRDALRRNRVVCAGMPAGSGKLTAPAIDFLTLIHLADYVLVEADGSRGLPLKAHASYEPVIPSPANNVVLVVGADGFGKTVSSVCHRPSLWAQLAGVAEQGIATPEGEARVIRTEGYGSRVFINTVESAAAHDAASDLASRLDLPVTAGSLQRGEYRCLR